MLGPVTIHSLGPPESTAPLVTMVSLVSLVSLRLPMWQSLLTNIPCRMLATTVWTPPTTSNTGSFTTSGLQKFYIAFNVYSDIHTNPLLTPPLTLPPSSTTLSLASSPKEVDTLSFASDCAVLLMAQLQTSPAQGNTPGSMSTCVWNW